MIIQIHQKQMSAPRVQICSRFLPTVEFFLADLGEEDVIVLVDGVSGPPPHYYYFFDLMSAFIAFRVPLTSSTETRKHSSCCISGTLFSCSQITHFYSSHMTESLNVLDSIPAFFEWRLGTTWTTCQFMQFLLVYIEKQSHLLHFALRTI